MSNYVSEKYFKEIEDIIDSYYKWRAMDDGLFMEIEQHISSYLGNLVYKHSINHYEIDIYQKINLNKKFLNDSRPSYIFRISIKPNIHQTEFGYIEIL